MPSKQNFIWNMIGSGIYAMSTVLFLLLAKRVAGEEAGAKFYMAFTTGQMLLTIGYFEIRPFQVTDVYKEYQPQEYFGFRAITSFAMLIAGIAVCFVYFLNGKINLLGIVLIMSMCLYKMSDGYSDVFEGEFQRNDRIDLAGKAMGFRTLACLAIFGITIFVTKNVYLSSVLTALVGIAGTAIVGKRWSGRYGRFGLSIKKEKMKGLFNSTFLIFIGSAMCMWLWNGTKYVVEWNLSDADTLIYGILFMPNMVINLCSTFILKPMLTTLAKYYSDGDKKSFDALMIKLSLVIALLTFICLCGGVVVGIPVLEVMYDVELGKYTLSMLILILAGGVNAVSVLIYYALMVMRRQKQIFVGYGISFAVSLAAPVILVKTYGIFGAALSYLLIMGILLLAFGIMLGKKEEG